MHGDRPPRSRIDPIVFPTRNLAAHGVYPSCRSTRTVEKTAPSFRLGEKTLEAFSLRLLAALLFARRALLLLICEQSRLLIRRQPPSAALHIGAGGDETRTPCRLAYSLLRIPAESGLLSRGHRCKEHKSSDGRIGASDYLLALWYTMG
jgi:hypothetical protein